MFPRGVSSSLIRRCRMSRSTFLFSTTNNHVEYTLERRLDLKRVLIKVACMLLRVLLSVLQRALGTAAINRRGLGLSRFFVDAAARVAHLSK